MLTLLLQDFSYPWVLPTAGGEEVLGEGPFLWKRAAEAALSFSLSSGPTDHCTYLGHVPIEAGTGMHLNKTLYKAQLLKQNEAIVERMTVLVIQ